MPHEPVPLSNPDCHSDIPDNKKIESASMKRRQILSWKNGRTAAQGRQPAAASVRTDCDHLPS